MSRPIPDKKKCTPEQLLEYKHWKKWDKKFTKNLIKTFNTVIETPYEILIDELNSDKVTYKFNYDGIFYNLEFRKVNTDLNSIINEKKLRDYLKSGINKIGIKSYDINLIINNINFIVDNLNDEVINRISYLIDEFIQNVEDIDIFSINEKNKNNDFIIWSKTYNVEFCKKYIHIHNYAGDYEYILNNNIVLK